MHYLSTNKLKEVKSNKENRQDEISKKQNAKGARHDERSH